MMTSKVEGETLDLCVELSICIFGRRVDEGKSVGCCLDLLGEERVEIEVGIKDRHGDEQYAAVWLCMGKSEG